MRKIWGIMAVGASLIAAGPATAQSWGIYVGTGGDHPRYDRGYRDDDRLARVICSGQRAHMLEDRLRHEVDENEIDDDDADRIHAAIDRLEDRQHHECSEGDRGAIVAIARRYDRIGQWIDSEAHRGW